jgi:hypothetical protein
LPGFRSSNRGNTAPSPIDKLVNDIDIIRTEPNVNTINVPLNPSKIFETSAKTSEIIKKIIKAVQNLTQKNRDNFIGDEVIDQNECPSRLILGKTNLTDKVARINPVNAKFAKPIIVFQ